jgi:chorismate mutase
LIERVQFPYNRTIYQPGAIEIPNSTLSFFDWYLWQQEQLQSTIRRYQSPDEYPFFPEALQNPILAPLNYPRILHPNKVNVNKKIKASYIDHFLPQACPELARNGRGEDKENYGSSAVCDLACLQALSRRIHFGKFVAESKFRSEKERFTRLIQAGDVSGIEAAITNAAVEKAVLERLRLKARTYGTDPTEAIGTGQGKINEEAVVKIYRDFVIPLTKEVEVEYLMARLDASGTSKTA